MRFRLEATPQELESKGDALLKALIDEFHDVDHDLAERLEKSLPPKEPVLKYPVLRAIHKKTAQAYDAMLQAMLVDIGKVLDQSVAGQMKKALEPEDELEKAKYTKRTINPNPPPKYLYEYAEPKKEVSEYKWERQPDGGYQLLGGKVKLERRGKEFFLVVPSVDKEISLGKRATFDSANRALDELLASTRDKKGAKEGDKKQAEIEKPQQKQNPKLEKLGTAEATENGVTFKTGEPVTFDFIRNTGGSGKPPPNDPYQQKLEPAGRFMSHVDKKNWGPEIPGQVRGTVTFKNPLVIHLNTGEGSTYDENSWKARLSKTYKKKGKALSRALADDGYDGIVTVQEFQGEPITSEIVDLRFMHTGIIEKGMLAPLDLEKAMDEAAAELSEPVYDHTQPLAEKDERAYNKVKLVLKRRGYKEADFERGGKLFGMSTNELIDLARGDDATDR